MSIFFIPLGIILILALVIEVLAIYYAQTLAQEERKDQAIAQQQKRPPSDSDSSEQSAIGVDAEDTFFRGFKS
ncbi:unnamed protein product [Heligmosomoides polygyrus]|uniref:Col_cuticle_N domain-containing protein n=1 Tax=Heligmosomoides polygyrus TaxID=6339 RepID=A0A183GCK0_HELPZ|nr:unnamed protein product [Heligmosomoides polygyrus]